MDGHVLVWGFLFFIDLFGGPFLDGLVCFVCVLWKCGFLITKQYA